MCLYAYTEIRLLETDMFCQDNGWGTQGIHPLTYFPPMKKEILNTSGLAEKLYLFRASQEMSSRQNIKRVSYSILITFTSLNLIANILIC